MAKVVIVMVSEVLNIQVISGKWKCFYDSDGCIPQLSIFLIWGKGGAYSFQLYSPSKIKI